MSVPSVGIYFTAYEQLKRRATNYFGEASAVVPLSSGMSARLFACLLTSPLEMARARVQARASQQPSTYSRVIRSVVRREGVFGLWKGLWAYLLRDVPFSGVYWVLSEKLRARLLTERPDGAAVGVFWINLLCGLV